MDFYGYDDGNTLFSSDDGFKPRSRKLKLTFFDYQFSVNGSDYSADGAVEFADDEIIVSVYLLAVDSDDTWVEVTSCDELNYVSEYLARNGEFAEYAETLYNLNV